MGGNEIFWGEFGGPYAVWGTKLEALKNGRYVGGIWGDHTQYGGAKLEALKVNWWVNRWDSQPYARRVAEFSSLFADDAHQSRISSSQLRRLSERKA